MGQLTRVVRSATATVCVLMMYTTTAVADIPVFINEIHYDNASTDTGEAVEIAGPAGTSLSGWTLELYNGNGGSSYGTVSLSGTFADQEGGMGTLSFAKSGIQNGAPDGMALVDASSSDGTAEAPATGLQR